MKEFERFEWFEWFEWFGPSPIEPFNPGLQNSPEVHRLVKALAEKIDECGDTLDAQA